MPGLDRITRNPAVMGGKPCVRGMRVAVGMIVGLVASGHGFSEILAAYPYLEDEDIRQALEYAAWRVEENRSAAAGCMKFPIDNQVQLTPRSSISPLPTAGLSSRTTWISVCCRGR